MKFVFRLFTCFSQNTISTTTTTTFLVIVQLDAQIPFNVFIYLYFSTCFEHVMLIIRRNRLYQYSFW